MKAPGRIYMTGMGVRSPQGRTRQISELLRSLAGYYGQATLQMRFRNPSGKLSDRITQSIGMRAHGFSLF